APARGGYGGALWAEGAGSQAQGLQPVGLEGREAGSLLLSVNSQAAIRNPQSVEGCCGPALETVQGALVEADRLQRLPEDYTDVTEGTFAKLKRRIKRKLLGNFKHAYVDVLSRQQSAFNAQLLSGVRELAECCAPLDRAVRVLLERVADSAELGRAQTRGLQPVGLEGEDHLKEGRS